MIAAVQFILAYIAALFAPDHRYHAPCGRYGSPVAPATEDDIGYTAFLLAEADGFKNGPDHYWHEAERRLMAR
jgi:hypothetical protein